jgi:hypothetical protein
VKITTLGFESASKINQHVDRELALADLPRRDPGVDRATGPLFIFHLVNALRAVVPQF